MRTKGGLDEEVVQSGDWKDQGPRGNPMSTLEVKRVNGERIILVHSFSGNERNKLFVNKEGQTFDDVSTYSGVDSVTDSRCFASWDYDHDGAIDIALINSNAPHVEVFRNEHLKRSANKSGFLVIRLVGGNAQAQASEQWSNRNGVGAKIVLKVGRRELLREVRRGEGFSTQNTADVVVGLGDAKQADVVTIVWPSGKSQVANNLAAGKRVTFFENPDSSTNGSGFDIESYEFASSSRVAERKSSGLLAIPMPDSVGQAEIRVLIGMATWCESCKSKLPNVKKLVQAVNDPRVAFVGVPIDPQDSESKLQKYETEYEPAYRLLTDLGAVYRKGFAGYLRQQLGSDALPNTVITDAQGNPLQAQFGIPTVSQIRRLVESAR